MVDDEERVMGEEDEVVEEVYQEVGRAELQDRALGGGVGRGEAARRLCENRTHCQECGGGPMGQGGEATRGEGAGSGAPVAEEKEVGKEVDQKECHEECLEGWGVAVIVVAHQGSFHC